VVDLNAKPATTTATAKPATRPNNMTLELGAGALALLLLGGGAYAISRRRRAREEEMWANEQQWSDEPMVEQDTAEPIVEQTPVEAATMPEIGEERIEEPAMGAAAGASAFAWGNGERKAEERESQVEAADESDRRPGESWVERAYRGPSPANPSVSLKARLKRAAFFDKREREVAAGIAEPVDTDEGLPEAMVEEQQERELA
jgi:hypothetical protein